MQYSSSAALSDHAARVLAVSEPPPWLQSHLCYVVRLGSAAYGADGPRSDFDLFGICTPPVEEAFPGLDGNIMGFDDTPEPFDHWKVEHAVLSTDLPTFDVTAYNLTGFLRSCRGGAFNMIEALFADEDLVIQTSLTGQYLRERRQMLLSKLVARRFLSAGRMHLAVLIGRRKRSNFDRAALISLHGYDTKQAFHVVRLLLSSEMIATEHTLDLRRNSKTFLAIRSGAWDYEKLLSWAEQKIADLQYIIDDSSLRVDCDDDAIRRLLLECLEQRYGSLERIGLRSDLIHG